jgi:hypothetical protein
MNETWVIYKAADPNAQEFTIIPNLWSQNIGCLHRGNIG